MVSAPMALLLPLLLVLIATVHGQLVVNIKNIGGEVFQQRIAANTSADTITLEYRDVDGSLITILVDYRNVSHHRMSAIRLTIVLLSQDVEISRVMLLGEEERGDRRRYQTLCFVTSVVDNDLITADAMSKLRQKHPSSIRVPDHDNGVEQVDLDLMVELSKSAVITPHLRTLCVNATTFARERDLAAWTNDGTT